MEASVADKSAIEWTDATWNPVTGCTKISPGCDHCYAERFSERFRGVPGHPFEYGFDLTLRPERLAQPLGWRRPRMIFVNSMSDLFHKDVPTEFVERVFATMERADWHIYQVLTKRSPRMRDFVNRRYRGGRAPAHIWLGTSLENRAQLSRLRHIQAMNASIRFLSIEPMLGPVGRLDLEGIHWVIVGGESGPGFRPIEPDWIREVRDQCAEARVAFFFKQWGGMRPKTGGRALDGTEWNEYPNLVVEKQQPSLTGLM
jgi:protein gp37